MARGRNVRGGAELLDPMAQSVGVTGLFGEHDGGSAEMRQEPLGGGTIARLAGRQDRGKGPAAGIGQHMNLGFHAAARAAHPAIRVALFCGCSPDADARAQKYCRSSARRPRKSLYSRP